MSNAPYLLRNARFGYRMGNGQFEDMMVHDGLQRAIECVHMGLHGGKVAAEEHVSREEQDAWALRSHLRAVAAIDEGRLPRDRLQSYRALQRELKRLAAKQDGRLRAEERKKRVKQARSRRKVSW